MFCYSRYPRTKTMTFVNDVKVFTSQEPHNIDI